MPVSDDDFIQDGTVTTTWPDATTTTEPLNPQSHATDETADRLVEYLNENYPEGREWTKKDINVSQGQVTYSCPCWQAVAANGFMVNAGNCYYNLFFYPDPTPAQETELHEGASKPPAT